MYNMSNEEKEYLEKYDMARYDRPSIAADMAVFSIMGKNDNVDKTTKKVEEKNLKILLIKRAAYPYKECWALPGGFCKKNEDIADTARRELYEETKVKNAYLDLIGTFGDVGRDPRGWIISHTFLALIDGQTSKLKAGSDAWEARWFDIELKVSDIQKRYENDTANIETLYRLHLTNEDSKVAIELTANIRERRIFKDYHETVSYEIEDEKGLAFDHAKIITCALINLRRKVEIDGKIVFDLMPEYFTLTQLKRSFEIIQDKTLIASNFRRKISEYVIETDKMISGTAFRPAKLFKRKIERFYE